MRRSTATKKKITTVIITMTTQMTGGMAKTKAMISMEISTATTTEITTMVVTTDPHIPSIKI